MHCVSLTCGTGPDIRDWMGLVTSYRLKRSYTRTPPDLSVKHLFEVTLRGSFASTMPLEPLSLTDVSDGGLDTTPAPALY